MNSMQKSMQIFQGTVLNAEDVNLAGVSMKTRDREAVKMMLAADMCESPEMADVVIDLYEKRKEQVDHLERLLTIEQPDVSVVDTFVSPLETDVHWKDEREASIREILAQKILVAPKKEVVLDVKSFYHNALLFIFIQGRGEDVDFSADLLKKSQKTFSIVDGQISLFIDDYLLDTWDYNANFDYFVGKMMYIYQSTIEEVLEGFVQQVSRGYEVRKVFPGKRSK